MASGNELTRRKVSSKAGPGGDVAAASAGVTATAASGSSVADERKTSAATLPGSTSVCFSCLNRQMRNFGQNLRPERWKTLLAFLYVLLVSWLTAFVMVIVHDRVPDMERYPPLPDLLLGEKETSLMFGRFALPPCNVAIRCLVSARTDNLPHIPWAFEMCELCAMTLLVVWVTVCLFHKHR